MLLPVVLWNNELFWVTPCSLLKLLDIFRDHSVFSFRAKQYLNSSSAGIYRYITQVWMIWVAKGKCGWWNSGGEQSI